MQKFYGGITGQSFESENCISCFFGDACVGARRLTDNKLNKNKDKNKDLLVESQHKEKEKSYREHYQNLNADFGMEMHRRLAEERNLITSQQEIVESLKMGKNVAFSALICSQTYGLRGTPDAIVIRFKNDEMIITVIEDKYKYHSEDIKQVLAYAIILTAADAQMIADVKQNSKPVKIHDLFRNNISYSVSAVLNYYGVEENMRNNTYIEVSKNGAFNPEIIEEIKATLRKADFISNTTTRSKIMLLEEKIALLDTTRPKQIVVTY